MAPLVAGAGGLAAVGAASYGLSYAVKSGATLAGETYRKIFPVEGNREEPAPQLSTPERLPPIHALRSRTRGAGRARLPGATGPDRPPNDRSAGRDHCRAKGGAKRSRQALRRGESAAAGAEPLRRAEKRQQRRAGLADVARGDRAGANGERVSVRQARWGASREPADLPESARSPVPPGRQNIGWWKATRPAEETFRSPGDSRTAAQSPFRSREPGRPDAPKDP